VKALVTWVAEPSTPMGRGLGTGVAKVSLDRVVRVLGIGLCR
jgi:hypothetical protein